MLLYFVERGLEGYGRTSSFLSYWGVKCPLDLTGLTKIFLPFSLRVIEVL